jgi:hypothetical protein
MFLHSHTRDTSWYFGPDEGKLHFFGDILAPKEDPTHRIKRPERSGPHKDSVPLGLMG